MLDEPERELNNTELKTRVSEIKNALPGVREKLILGPLKSMGIG